ncbi:ParB N-terminal domain-containing protein [candidate division KSB1 bacterium]|nr:ParB N-terminal domain-containing protein [candidate division KSB1 bacterium]
MINTSYHIIKLDEIDDRNEMFRIKESGDLQNLIVSIRKAGLLTPLYVYRKENQKYRQVTGFKRLAALKKLVITHVPVFIVKDDLTEIELFEIALLENLSVQQFRPSEISIIIKKLHDFGQNREDIIKKYLPLLGFGRNPKVYDLYKDLYKLEKHWLEALDGDRISIDLAFLLVNADKSDRHAFWTVVDSLRAGKNNQREFWFLCRDIIKMENTSLKNLLESPDTEQILNNPVLTFAQKTERFKNLLWEKRYPRYMKVKQEYNTVLKSAKLPPGLNILHAPFFEGDSYNVHFEFKSEQEFIQKIQLLQSVSDKGILKVLLELV